MDMIVGMLFVWMVHAVIAGLLSTPVIVLGRKRVHWQWWELSAWILPFSVWLLLMFSELSAGKKSLANLGEPFYFSFAIPLAALVRVAVGTRIAEVVCSVILLGALCAIAAAVFFVVPSLPE
jgi:hypothetical protein